MKFIFETEDEQEALMYSSAPEFYAALHEIREFLRQSEKYGLESSIQTSIEAIEFIREKINEIIYEEAPNFNQIR